MGLQFNRALVRKAINLFFTGDPKEHPDLAAVHKEMGLSGENKILGESHPLVVAAAARSPGAEFILVPQSHTQERRKQLCSTWEGFNFCTVSTDVR